MRPNQPKKTNLSELLPQALGDSLESSAKIIMKERIMATKPRPHPLGEESIYGATMPFYKKLFMQPTLAVMLAVIIILAGAGTAIAADHAKPGDSLYPVDRALEQVAYNFSLSDTAKADMLVKFADEREEEQAALAQTNRTQDAEQASHETEQALQNATEVIDRVQAEHGEDDKSRSAETLSKVEEKLNEIQNRYTERHREEVKDRVKNALGEVEIEATIKNGQATVKLHYNGQEIKYALDTADINAIIASVQQRTNLSADDIRALLKIETEDESSDDSHQSTNANTNAAINTNRQKENGDSSNQNRNTNTRIDDSRNTNSAVNTNMNSDESNRNENKAEENKNENQQRQNEPEN